MLNAGVITPILKPGFPGVLKVIDTPISGLYEVITASNSFFCSDDGYILVGHMLTPDGRLVSAKEKASPEHIELTHAVKIGNGSKIIIMFANLDCLYSKALNKKMNGMKDLTRYVFFKHSNNPSSMAVTAAVLDDPSCISKAYSADRGDLSQHKISPGTRLRLGMHNNMFCRYGIKTTPVAIINGEVVCGAADILDRLGKDGAN